MAQSVEKQLARLGLALPAAAAPAANYEPFSVSRGLIFIASQAPVLDGKHQSVGKVGAEVTLQALGDAGKHARSALGVAALRGDVPVVIDAIFEIAN